MVLRYSEAMDAAGCNTLQRDLCTYIGVMFMGMVISSFLFDGASIVFWGFNVLGWSVLFKYVRIIPRNTGILAVCYLFIMGLLPCIFHSGYISMNVKGIGTNIGLIIVPLYLCFFINLKHHGNLSQEGVTKILYLISGIGTILFLSSVLIGGQDYIRVLDGSIGAYSAQVSGLLKNKNMYGAILALSTCCDFFLIKTKDQAKHTKRWPLFALKALGVVFSFSRAALLQFAVAIFMFIWFEKKRASKEWAMLILAILGITVLFLKNESFRAVVVGQIIRIDIGDAGRRIGIADALSKVTGSLPAVLFGVGYFGIEALNIDIDSSYYHTFFSGGLLKCAFYIYWVYLSFKQIRRLKLRSPLYSNMCMSMAASYLAYAMFESIPLFELGILTFIFMLFMYIIPCAYRQSIL